MCFLCSSISRAPSCFDPALGGIPGDVPGALPPPTMNAMETSDYAESVATTAVLTLGVSEYGTIGNSTDEDWFSVSLVAGQTYEFRMLGVGSAFLTDPLLRVRDSAGTQLATNDDGFTSGSSTHEADSRLTFTAISTGTYYIEADTFSTGTGTYLLTGVVENVGGMVFTIDEIAWQLTNNGEAYFGSAEAAAFNVGLDGQLTVNITNLTAEGQTLARAALLAWGDLTGIQFTETNGAAEISFDDSDAGAAAYADMSISGTTITSSTVMITTGWLADFGTTFNSYSYEVYIHEIGHALGFGHGGNYNGSATFGIDNYYLNDSVAYSIMSYMPAIGDEFGTPNTFVNADFRFMLTPVLADFVAIDRLYGGSTNTRTGNTTYGFNSNTGNAQLDAAVSFGADVNFMVHDNGGNDTLDFSGSSTNQSLSLAADTFSSVLGGVFNLSVSRETVIENAIGGSGNDTITGNTAANSLVGGDGRDNLVGDAGTDTLDGGIGNDLIYGGVGNDSLIGGDGIDTLSGGSGVDLIDGGIGNDLLIGGNSGDTYIVNAAGDIIVEAVGQGADRVLASANYTLDAAADVEVMQTISVGSVTAINLTGNAIAQQIFGNNGINTLDGGAGAADTLTGNGGNDTYIIRNAGTVIVEGVGQGTADRVLAATGFVLAADDNIEVMQTISAGAATAINLTGNAVSQSFFGNAGANQIDGREGQDTMTGGAGADRFVFGTAMAPTNVDFITDFAVGVDEILLEGGFFTGIGNGGLTTDRFHAGAGGQAINANVRIIYETDNGNLWYDADGNGAGLRVLFGNLLGAPVGVTFNDFTVF